LEDVGVTFFQSPSDYTMRKKYHLVILLAICLCNTAFTQVGTLRGTGMSICNIYSFSVCPNQTITPFNYGNQGYACNGTTQPDVSFNILGGVWRVNKFNWNFSATTNGFVSGYTSTGVFQSFPFAATNTISPLSYSGNFVQFAINGVATGSLISQASFSISLSPVVFGSNSYSYCPTANSNISISPIIPTQGGPWTYVWQPGGLTGNPINVNPQVNTIYTVTANSSAGCVSSTTIDLSINCSTTPTISIASFSSPDTVCINQQFNVVNQSIAATSYYWSFCQGNTNTIPQGINLGNVGFLNGPVFISIAKDGANYYAFVTNNSNSTIVRLFFGTSLMNTPVATNLGNVGGQLPGNLEDIHLELENGNWYGIVTGGMSGGERLVRLNFGTSLANTPTATNFGNIGGLNYPQRIKIFQSNGNYFGFIANRNNNTISRISFGNSIANTPTGLNLGNIGALNIPDALGLINYNNLWYGYVINEGNNTISRLDFGASLLNIPTGVNIGNTGALNGPRAIDMWTECGQIKGLITNRFSNDILNMNFSNGPTGAVNTVSYGNIASFSFPHSITRFRVGDTLYAFITNVSNNSISRLYFPNCTNSSIASTTLSSPPPISYNSPGIYYINQVINEGLISQASYCKQITVIASPTVSVLSSSVCSGQIATITASGASVYNWSTGANTNSISVSPTSTTIYTVTGSIGTCTSQAISTVSVIPSYSISVSGNTLICSGQTTTLTANGAPFYSWSNGATTSSLVVTPNVNTTYNASASGSLCANTSAITVSVIPMPTITVSSNTSICQGNGSATLTVNGANSYTWINSSSLSSPTGSSVIASPNITSSYTVTGVTGICSNTAAVTVSVNLSPTITAVSYTNTTCGLSNGAITISSLPVANTYTWSSGIGSISNSVSSLASGNYTVSVFNGACPVSTVVPISSSFPLQIVSSNITNSNCGANNGSIFVDDNYSNSNYSWAPNIDSTKNLTNLAPGTYSLSITNGACSTTTLFTVAQLSGPNEINTTKIGAICENSNGSISITSVSNGVFPYQYSFNNSGYSSITTYSNLTQGVYTITVKDTYGCVFTQTVTVDKTMLNTSIDLTTNYPSCNSNDGSFLINSISGGTPPFSLSFNGLSYSTDTVFEQLGYGNYPLLIKDANSCVTSFVLDLLTNKNDYTLYIPNTFTPNQDMVNDVWHVSGTCIKSFNCLIYNRWGEKITEINSIMEGWDGKYKGKDVPDGVYVYLIQVETNDGTVYKNGHITLFR